jgi:RHS repeat-associated protein
VWGGGAGGGGGATGGWLLLEELNGLSSNAVTRKYTWGLDLAGQSGGGIGDRGSGIGGTGVSPVSSAGGIGGLLSMYVVSGAKSYVYFYDAIGNIGQVIDWSQSTASAALKAHYVYDPYGNRINSPISGEVANDFRFSTKHLDSKTGLYYYGYRFYNPKLGRWLNRDPIGEKGGIALYGFVQNRTGNVVDPIGLQDTCYTLYLDRVHRDPERAAQLIRDSDFVLQSALDLAANPTVRNIAGVVGGTCEITVGVVVVICTGGIAGIVGVVPILHGADTLGTALGGIPYDVAVPTVTYSIGEQATGSPWGGAVLDFGVGCAGLLGGNAVLRLGSIGSLGSEAATAAKAGCGARSCTLAVIPARVRFPITLDPKLQNPLPVLNPQFSIWDFAPVARGNAADVLLGGNLPAGVPCIDALDAAVACSNKSIDLGAKSYQNMGRLRNLVCGYIDDLARYTEGRRAMRITPTMFSGKELRLAIPANSASCEQLGLFRALEDYARVCGVAMRIYEVP